MPLLLALALTCYRTNATFYYNDVRKNGVIRATPVDDTTEAYVLCQYLQGRMFRLEIELSSEISVDGQIIYHRAYSDSAIFDFASELEMTAIVPDIHRNAALQTRISSFVLKFQDVSAEIRYTLASYSIAAFEFNYCIKRSDVTIADLSMIVIQLETVECAVTTTQFVQFIDDTTPGFEQQKNESAELVLQLEGTGEIRRFIGQELLDLINQASRHVQNASIDLIFECSQLQGQYDTCERIIRFLQYSPLYKLSVLLSFKLANPAMADHRLIMKSVVSSVSDPRYVDCYYASYAHTSEAIIIISTFYSANPQCRKTLHRNTVIYFLIYQYSMYDLGVYYLFDFSFDNFTESTSFISHTCYDEACTSALQTLMRGYPIAKLRYYMYDDYKQYLGFVSVAVTRTYDCFGSVNAAVYSTDDDSYIVLSLQPYEHPGCQYINGYRAVLQLFLYRRRYPDAPIHAYDRDAICMFEKISHFSISNITLMFPVYNCSISVLQDLLRANQLSAELYINDMRIFIFRFDNQMYKTENWVEYGVFIGVALVLSVASFFFNWFWDDLVARKRCR